MRLLNRILGAPLGDSNPCFRHKVQYCTHPLTSHLAPNYVADTIRGSFPRLVHEGRSVVTINRICKDEWASF